MKWDVVVIGAGAAGMMCAAAAAQRGRKVLVLESSKAPGEKLTLTYLDSAGAPQTVEVTLGKADQ